MSELPMAGLQDVRDASYEHAGWHVTVRADHSLQDAMHPTYLWHHNQRMSPGQFITYHHAQRKFVAQTYIVEIDQATQSVRQILLFEKHIDAAKLPIGSIEKAVINWGGPQHKYRVILGTELLKAGFDRKEDAQAWIDEQMSRVGEKVAA